jgi:4-carboxymuconolactone decarboxylase
MSTSPSPATVPPFAPGSSPAPRIAPLDPPYAPGVDALLARLMPPGVPPLKLFRTLAHNAAVLETFAHNGALVFRLGSLDPTHREIVIQRTCALCGAEYEWGVHAAFFGKRTNVDAARLAATLHCGAEDPVWAEAEAVLIRLADELHASHTISDALWRCLRKHWTDAQIIELIVLAGFYHTVSYLVNGLGIELESFGARFVDAAPTSSRAASA